MDLGKIVHDWRGALQDVLHVDWLSTAITIIGVLIVTAIISHLVTGLIRKIMHVDKNPLPSSTIFINIARVAVWVIGICVILSSCFGVNITAAMTALGIGGLAISLGFQATLSNLIGGLQLSLTKLVVPGDHIQVGTNSGIVRDMTWRHTSIVTTRGENVIIPNSVINTEALIKLPPQTTVRQAISLSPRGRDLDKLTTEIENAINKKLQTITLVEEPAKISLIDVTERAYTGMLSFALGEGANVGAAKDAALRIVAQYNEEDRKAESAKQQ